MLNVLSILMNCFWSLPYIVLKFLLLIIHFLLLRLKRFQFWSERISELHQAKEFIFFCKILNKTKLFFKQPLMYVFNLRVYTCGKLSSGLWIWILNPIPFFFLFHHSCAAYITSKQKWEIQNIYHYIAFK